MISSLGSDATTCCAAARAGITRSEALSFCVVRSEDHDLEPIVGHVASMFTDGFEGIGRILRLAQGAAADFRRDGVTAGLNPDRCGLKIALPDLARSSRVIRALGPKDGEYDNPYLMSQAPAAEQDRQRILDSIRRAAGLAVPDRNCAIVQAGHAGFITAAEAAMEGIARGEWECCIVGAFDSLVEPATLHWLSYHGRLKSADGPVGLQPGEAGVYVLMEPLVRARQRGTRIRGVLRAAAVSFEKDHLFSGGQSFGRGIAEAIRGLKAEMKSGFAAAWILCDLNGEEHRAADWGNAVTCLIRDVPSLAEAEVVCPAASFGDTEAASGAVGLCYALHVLARSPARAGSSALVLSSSASGERGALYVQGSMN